MIQIPRLFMFVAWVLIGPFNIRQAIPTLLVPAITFSALGVAILVRKSSRGQSLALLAVLGIMVLQSLQSVAAWLHVELIHSPFVEAEEVRHIISFFFTLNAGLAAVGAIAALGVALSLEIRKARVPLARLFPEMEFATAPIEVVKSVERLSKIAGIPLPTVCLIDSGDPAAFITRSRQGCVLAVSVGLLESLGADEIDACLAHELAHLKNKDFPVRSFATTARVALFGHPLSHVIEPAVYRARELLADRTAVQLVGNRRPLISALSKIRESQEYMLAHSGSMEAACLFNPASKNRFTRLFDKHPTMEERIRALRGLKPFE
jgi:heat shock protein HtpX